MPIPGSSPVVGVVLVSLPFTAHLSGGLGALGGYLESQLRDRDADELDGLGGDRGAESLGDDGPDRDESPAD